VALLSKSTSEELLSLQIVTVTGEFYRIVFGKKIVTAKITTEKPNDIDSDKVILYAKEQIPGVDYTKYTVNYIDVEKPTANNTPDNSPDFKIDVSRYLGETNTDINPNVSVQQGYKYYPVYSLEGKVFNYKVVPTLTKGPKVIRNHITPNRMLNLEGRLSRHFITTDAYVDYTPPSDFRPGRVKEQADTKKAIEITY